MNIQSIAIPPLGSGNEGLVWNEVKSVIKQKLKAVDEDVQIFIYEPSQNSYTPQPKAEHFCNFCP